jgi:hypothetical protein
MVPPLAPPDPPPTCCALARRGWVLAEASTPSGPFCMAAAGGLVASPFFPRNISPIRLSHRARNENMRQKTGRIGRPDFSLGVRAKGKPLHDNERPNRLLAPESFRASVGNRRDPPPAAHPGGCRRAPERRGRDRRVGAPRAPGIHPGVPPERGDGRPDLPEPGKRARQRDLTSTGAEAIKRRRRYLCSTASGSHSSAAATWRRP